MRVTTKTRPRPVTPSYRSPLYCPGPARVPARALVGRGAAPLVYAFETRRPTDAADAPPRTVGWTAVLAGPALGGPAGEAEAVAICTGNQPHPAAGEAARDKVVLCDLAGRTLVYQGDRDKAAASLCACGNAAGASAAMLAGALGIGRMAQALVLPDGEVRMEAEVRRRGAAWRVSQSWKGARFEVAEATLAGREVAVCRGTLNDYLVVRLGSAAAVGELTLDEVKGLWQAAGGSGGFQDLLRCRLAAVSPEGAVRFFTSGRLHPGAPLTGLAVLALAARRVGWLAPVRELGKVAHRRGMDALPEVRESGGTMDVVLPAVDVVLRRA